MTPALNPQKRDSILDNSGWLILGSLEEWYKYRLAIAIFLLASYAVNASAVYGAIPTSVGHKPVSKMSKIHWKTHTQSFHTMCFINYPKSMCHRFINLLKLSY